MEYPEIQKNCPKLKFFRINEQQENRLKKFQKENSSEYRNEAEVIRDAIEHWISA